MKNHIIVYGSDSGVQKKAIEQLSKIIFDYTDVIPVAIQADAYEKTENCRYFFIGTNADNPQLPAIPDEIASKKEAYCIRVSNDTVQITGSDDAGVLYGCIDFYEKYILQVENRHLHQPSYFIDIFNVFFVQHKKTPF